MSEKEIIKAEVPRIYKGYLANSSPMEVFGEISKFEESVYRYINECERNNSLPRKTELCIRLNISVDTYNRWVKFSDTINKSFEELSEFDQHRFLYSLVLKKANDMITNRFEKTILSSDRDNSVARIFYAKSRLGWVDTPQNQQNTQININISSLDEKL